MASMEKDWIYIYGKCKASLIKDMQKKLINPCSFHFRNIRSVIYLQSTYKNYKGI